MATNETNSQASLWDWIQGMFSPRPDSGGPSSEQPPRRGRVITVCLLISTFLWFTFTIRGTYTATITMPTQVRNIPENEALASLPPDHVRVQVEGEGFSLIRMNYNPPVIPIDATNDIVNLEEAVRGVPQNVRIMSVSPATFNLQKEPVVSRRVPIRSRLDIRPPNTYELLDEPLTNPDSVEVTGARSIISDLTEWPTVEQTYRNVRDSLVTTVALSDSLSSLVRKSVQYVQVKAYAGHFTDGYREIGVSVVGGPQEAVTLEPETIVVRYKVLFSDHDRALTTPDFFATVLFEDILNDTTGRIVPTLNLPEGVTLRDVEMIPSSLRYFQRLE